MKRPGAASEQMERSRRGRERKSDGREGNRELRS